MKVSNDDLKIDKLERINDKYIIKGDGFNGELSLYVDGKKVGSKYKNVHEIEITEKINSGRKKVYLQLDNRNGEFIQKTKTHEFDF